MVLDVFKEFNTSIIISYFETKIAKEHKVFFAFGTANAFFIFAKMLKSKFIIFYCLYILLFHLEHVGYFCIGFMSLSKIQCFFVVDQCLNIRFFFSQAISNFYVGFIVLLGFKGCLICVHCTFKVILDWLMNFTESGQSLPVLRLNFKHFFQDYNRLLGRYLTNNCSNFDERRNVIRFNCKCSFKIIECLSKVRILQI